MDWLRRGVQRPCNDGGGGGGGSNNGGAPVWVLQGSESRRDDTRLSGHGTREVQVPSPAKLACTETSYMTKVH